MLDTYLVTMKNPSHEANDGVFQPRFQADVTAPSQVEARYKCDGVTAKPPKAGVTGPADTNGQGEREVLEF